MLFKSVLDYSNGNFHHVTKFPSFCLMHISPIIKLPFKAVQFCIRLLFLTKCILATLFYGNIYSVISPKTKIYSTKHFLVYQDLFKTWLILQNLLFFLYLRLVFTFQNMLGRYTGVDWFSMHSQSGYLHTSTGFYCTNAKIGSPVCRSDSRNVGFLHIGSIVSFVESIFAMKSRNTKYIENANGKRTRIKQ